MHRDRHTLLHTFGDFFTVLVLATGMGTTAVADITREAANRLCIDVVVVERGRDIRGMLVSRNERLATMAVRREWLRTQQPEVYEEFRSEELQRLRDGDTRMIERIDAWITELDPDKDRQLIGILEGERDAAGVRIEDPDEALDGNQFVLLEIPVERMRAIYVAQPRQRQAGLCAYHFEFADVETSTLPEVEDRLDGLDPNWRMLTIDLTHRLAPRGEQSDREWAARQAIFEFQYREPMAFQGTGNAIVRVDTNGQGDIADALTQILGGGLTVDISTLLDIPELGGTTETHLWKQGAISAAEDEGVRVCRVTRVSPDLEGRTSIVDDVLLARMPDGTWETIYSVSITSRPSDVPDGTLDVIREDPQVAQIIGAAELLGVGTVELNQALTFGAVTMHAQSQADGKFRQFVDHYLRRLDGPPLMWQP